MEIAGVENNAYREVFAELASRIQEKMEPRNTVIRAFRGDEETVRSRVAVT